MTMRRFRRAVACHVSQPTTGWWHRGFRKRNSGQHIALSVTKSFLATMAATLTSEGVRTIRTVNGLNTRPSTERRRDSCLSDVHQPCRGISGVGRRPLAVDACKWRNLDRWWRRNRVPARSGRGYCGSTDQPHAQAALLYSSTGRGLKRSLRRCDLPCRGCWDRHRMPQATQSCQFLHPWPHGTARFGPSNLVHSRRLRAL